MPMKKSASAQTDVSIPTGKQNPVKMSPMSAPSPGKLTKTAKEGYDRSCGC